jgi:hypothetical protein
LASSSITGRNLRTRQQRINNVYEPNAKYILETLRPSDTVLDIGGWARPFNRANYVLDAEAYETRGYYGPLRPAQGGSREYFTKETWIQRDICEKTPFPFADKELDFVICSHTLEDIRDPLWVCAEMIRVAKRGYVEVPSRVVESCRGVEPGQVGWTHHRWLVDIRERRITFTMKYHMIHSRRKFSLPHSYFRSLTERETVQWLFWEDSFAYEEATIHGVENIATELQSFVQATSPYSASRLWLDDLGWGVGARASRAGGKLRRVLDRAVRRARGTSDDEFSPLLSADQHGAQ